MIYKLYIEASHAWHIVGGSEEDHNRITQKPQTSFILDGSSVLFTGKGFPYLYGLDDLVEIIKDDLNPTEEDITALSVVMGCDIREAAYYKSIILCIEDIEDFNSKFFPLIDQLLKARSL